MSFAVAVAIITGCGDDGPEAPAGELGWTKHAGNPVLVPGPAESWDAFAVGAPSVLDGGAGSYTMWYTGRGRAGADSRIGVATSSDGISWTKHAANPVFEAGAPGAWDALGVGDPSVSYDGIFFTMHYTGYGASGRAIGFATSDDGIAWTRSEANPVLAASAQGTAWDDREVYTPWVLREGTSYTMWYGGTGARHRAVGRASSDDGIAWVKQLAPVLEPQVLEALTSKPCVLERGGQYRMWYLAIHETPSGGAFPGVIDYAQSRDGIEWTLNRLALAPGPAESWDGEALRAACVLEEAAGTRMWYAGTSASGEGAIGVATHP